MAAVRIVVPMPFCCTDPVPAIAPSNVETTYPNEHYPTVEAYLFALADAMREEYKAIVDAGFLLQLDCPDLAREKHNTFADRPLADFIAGA